MCWDLIKVSIRMSFNCKDSSCNHIEIVFTYKGMWMQRWTRNKYPPRNSVFLFAIQYYAIQIHIIHHNIMPYIIILYKTTLVIFPCAATPAASRSNIRHPAFATPALPVEIVENIVMNIVDREGHRHPAFATPAASHSTSTQTSQTQVHTLDIIIIIIIIIIMIIIILLC